MDFIKDKFLIERGPVTDNKDGTFIVYYRIFYTEDTEKKTTLFKGHYIYDGDAQKLRNRVTALLTKLDNSALDTARDEIDAVLNTL